MSGFFMVYGGVEASKRANNETVDDKFELTVPTKDLKGAHSPMQKTRDATCLGFDDIAGERIFGDQCSRGDFFRMPV